MPASGVGAASEIETARCPLCGRELGDPSKETSNLDRHHLIPKSRKGKEQFLMHGICHRKIHSTLTEKELERQYNTWEQLQAHPEIAKFIDWIKGKPPEFYLSTANTNEKRRKR